MHLGLEERVPLGGAVFSLFVLCVLPYDLTLSSLFYLIYISVYDYLSLSSYTTDKVFMCCLWVAFWLCVAHKYLCMHVRLLASTLVHSYRSRGLVRSNLSISQDRGMVCYHHNHPKPYPLSQIYIGYVDFDVWIFVTCQNILDYMKRVR